MTSSKSQFKQVVLGVFVGLLLTLMSFNALVANFRQKFIAKIEPFAPACAPAGMCLTFAAASVAVSPKNGTISLKGSLPGNAGAIDAADQQSAISLHIFDGAREQPAIWRPLFRSFSGQLADPAFAELVLPDKTGHYLVTNDGTKIAEITVSAAPFSISGTLLSFVGYSKAQLAALVIAFSILVQATELPRATRHRDLGPWMAATLLRGLICIAVLLYATTAPETFLALALIGALMPLSLVMGFAGRPTSILIARIDAGPVADPLDGRALALGVLAVVAMIGQFYIQTINPSFRWSIFEERDFLAAGRVIADRMLPVLGPQLVGGGQTPGGSLYLLLAPLRLISDDPSIFALLNHILYMIAPILAFAAARAVAGASASAAAAIVLAASQVIVAYSYWPIHPAMSLPLNLAFLALVLHGFSKQNDRLMIAAAVLALLLPQLHFSYWLASLSFFILLGFYPTPNRNRILWGLLIAFVVLYGPYLVAEVSSGFANFHLILTHPRAPADAARPLDTAWLFVLLLHWLDGLWLPPLTPVITTALRLLFIAGLVMAGIDAVRFARSNGHGARECAVFALLIFFGLPFTILVISGLGYSHRHMIAFAPTIFVFVAIGVQRFFDLAPRVIKAFLPAVPVLLLLYWVGFLSDRDRAFEASRGTSEAEWAVDYLQRKEAAQYLITQLRMSSSQYAANAYWFWVGWSMTPELYRHQAALIGSEKDEAAPDAQAPAPFVMLLSGVTIANAVVEFFNLEPVKELPFLTIYRGTPKWPLGKLSLTSNTNNTAVLTDMLGQIELIRSSDGIFKLKAEGGDGQEQWYLISFLDGRMQLLLRLKKLGGGRIAWYLDSPQLGGYYQEYKTIWRPAFLLGNGGEQAEEVLYEGALGSAFVKTPQHGVVHCPSGSDDCAISFAISGYFDLASMTEPVTEHKIWKTADAKESAYKIRVRR
jgi:hypothetical protein